MDSKIKELFSRIKETGNGELKVDVYFTEEERDIIFDYNANNNSVLEEDHYDMFEAALFLSEVQLSYSFCKDDEEVYSLFICETRELNAGDCICHIDNYKIAECIGKLGACYEMENVYSGDFNKVFKSESDVRLFLERNGMKPSKKLDGAFE